MSEGGEGVRRASSSERGGEATNSRERSILSGAVPRSSPSTSDRPVSDLSKLRFLTSSSGRLLGFEPSFDRSSLVCVWSDSVPPRIFQARVVVRIRRDSSSPRGPRFPRVRSRRVRTATRARERRRPRRARVGAWVRRGALVRASARVRAGPRHVSATETTGPLEDVVKGSSCDWCGGVCDPEVSELNALSCSFAGCPPDAATYHQDCLERFLKSVGLDKCVRPLVAPAPDGEGSRARAMTHITPRVVLLTRRDLARAARARAPIDPTPNVLASPLRSADPPPLPSTRSSTTAGAARSGSSARAGAARPPRTPSRAPGPSKSPIPSSTRTATARSAARHSRRRPRRPPRSRGTAPRRRPGARRSAPRRSER